jgi:hypothetical protein
MPVTMSKQRCGFCSTGTHEHCPSVIINGGINNLLGCPCGCEQSLQVKCVKCYNSTADEVNPDNRECHDHDACQAKINTKIEQATARLYPKSEIAPPSRRQGCNCNCGEPTAGGQFRPGHADKLVAELVRQVKSGSTTVEAVTQILQAMSPGLVKKLGARL